MMDVRGGAPIAIDVMHASDINLLDNITRSDIVAFPCRMTAWVPASVQLSLRSEEVPPDVNWDGKFLLLLMHGVETLPDQYLTHTRTTTPVSTLFTKEKVGWSRRRIEFRMPQRMYDTICRFESQWCVSKSDVVAVIMAYHFERTWTYHKSWKDAFRNILDIFEAEVGIR